MKHIYKIFAILLITVIMLIHTIQAIGILALPPPYRIPLNSVVTPNYIWNIIKGEAGTPPEYISLDSGVTRVRLADFTLDTSYSTPAVLSFYNSLTDDRATNDAFVMIGIDGIPILTVNDSTIAYGDTLDFVFLKSLITKASDPEDGNDLKNNVKIYDENDVEITTQTPAFDTTQESKEYTFTYKLTDASGNLVIAKSKVTVLSKPINPPVDPPVDPPVNPPVNPPVDPPVNPPVDPPVDPPVNPPTPIPFYMPPPIIPASTPSSTTINDPFVYVYDNYPIVPTTSTDVSSVSSTETKVEQAELKPPVIYAQNLTIPIGTKFNFMEGITSFENNGEGNDITKRVTISGIVNTAKVGNYELVYKVTDRNGLTATKKIIIAISDKAKYIYPTDSVSKTDSPIINAKNITISAGEPFNFMKGVTAFENGGEGDNITNKITIKGIVNTAKPGDYKITYQVTDKNGKKATKTIIVTVIDKSKSN